MKSAGLITRQEGNILSVHSIAWQNDNIARQEAGAGAGKSAAGKSQYNPANTPTRRTGESQAECQREYDRR
ncbi:hypothetical protein ACLBOM_05100 [Escherichia coli]